MLTGASRPQPRNQSFRIPRLPSRAGLKVPDEDQEQTRRFPPTVSPPRDLEGFEAYHASSRRLLLSSPPHTGLGRPADHLQFSTFSKIDFYHDPVSHSPQACE